MRKSIEASPNRLSDLTKLSFVGKFFAKAHDPLSPPQDIKAQNEIIEQIRSGALKVLEGMLEVSSDPRTILKEVRSACFAGAEVTFISGQKQKIWEWDKSGMVRLLELSGFRVSQPAMRKDGTFEVIVRANRDEYGAYLAANHLPNPHVKHLIVTTEHSGYRVTGGIGSYVKECDVLYGDDAAILILDNNTDYERQTVVKNRWLAAQIFLSPERINEIEGANFDTLGDLTYEVLQSVLFFYPEIRSIESQEMLLNRTIEAKRLKIIDPTIKLITVCHGSSFHLSKAGRKVIDAENIHVAYREKFSIEHSDVTIFPTRFLKESYRQSGVGNLDDPSRIIKRLPFDYKRLPEGKRLTSYRRLIYIGKTSTVKGFDLFLQTLLFMQAHNPGLMHQFEEIKVVATSTNIHEHALQDLYREVESKLPITMISLGREELLRKLAEYSEDSLALITYQGDNHPLTVLELMAVGHDFIAANAAGTPELIPDAFKKDYLVAPEAEKFVDAIAKLSDILPDRSERIAELRKAYTQEQDKINESYSIEILDSYANIMSTSRTICSGGNPKVGVYVLGDQGLERDKTTASIKAQTNVDAYILKDLAEYKAYDAVIHIKVGDILYPKALSSMFELLNSRPNVGAALAYELAPSYTGSKLKGVQEFHPFPPELGSVFLQEKQGRRFVALIRTEAYKESTLSDWQKCIDIACKGQEIVVVPEILMELAIVDDYPNHDLMSDSVNLVRSFSALPVFDAYILHAELKRFDDLYWGAQLLNHLNDIYVRRDDPNIIWRNDPRYIDSQQVLMLIRIYRTKVPKIVRKTIYIVSRSTYRVARQTMRLARRFIKSVS